MEGGQFDSPCSAKIRFVHSAESPQSGDTKGQRQDPSAGNTHDNGQADTAMCITGIRADMRSEIFLSGATVSDRTEVQRTLLHKQSG